MPNFEVFDARIASALNKIIHNSHFKKKNQSGGTKGPKAGPFPSWQAECLLDVRLLPGHWSPWFCRELCRLVHYCSTKWRYSGIRFEVGRNFIVNDVNPTWWHLGRIVQIKNTRVWETQDRGQEDGVPKAYNPLSEKSKLPGRVLRRWWWWVQENYCITNYTYLFVHIEKLYLTGSARRTKGNYKHWREGESIPASTGRLVAVMSITIPTETESNDFGRVLESISRFEFDFRRRWNYFSKTNSNFCAIRVQSHAMRLRMCMFSGLFAPRQFHSECCCVRDDSWKQIHIYT